MGMSSTRRQVAVVAASVAAAGWLSAAGPAGATAGEAPPLVARVASATGVCGWFSEEFPDRFETVNVCGYDGVAAPDGHPGTMVRPLVVVDRYACSFAGDEGDCTGEHHEFTVDRRDFTIDPLLRRARIVSAGAGGCGVELEFVGTATSTPQGGISEYHGVAGGPWVAVSGQQTVTRPAHWWGRVCGRFVLANDGSGHGEMWRCLSAGAVHFPGGAVSPETA